MPGKFNGADLRVRGDSGPVLNRSFCLIPPILPVEPVHVHDGHNKTDTHKGRWHVPLPRKVTHHGREDEPQTNSEEEHACYDFFVGEGDIE